MGLIIDKKNFDCISSTEKELYNNSTSSGDFISQNKTSLSCDTIIGYSENGQVPIIFLLSSIFGLTINIIFLVKSFMPSANKSNSRKQSSMKKLFSVLPILDSVACLYWLFSSIFFWKAETIKNNRDSCSALSIIYFSVFTFEFIFINFILIHFRKISLNPIEGILKPGKNLKKYFSISILLTIAILIFAIGMRIIGRSPMNTCFINTEQSGTNALVFLIPFVSTLLVILQVIYDLKCRELFVNDKEVRNAYKNNSMYVLVFSLMHIPMFLLIFITSGMGKVIQDENGLPEYSFFTTVLTSLIPLIMGILRLCRGFTKIKKIQHLKRRITMGKTLKRSFKTENRDDNVPLNPENNEEDEFDWLEQHAMEFFMRDILLGIAHCIYDSKSYGKISFNNLINNLEEENQAVTKHNINFDNFKLNDDTVLNSQFLDVKIINYAPKIFAYLRNYEEINIDEMTESFLPKNNKKGISESQGKSGSFFISTDDSQYMVKTLKVDEFDLIRKTFLNEYVKYISKNKDSLLCRIYGMYNIILSQGEEILIIVMRNVIGEFKDNIVAKYDLKGSTKNRITEFEMEKTDSKTLKDLNFNEMERGIFISNDSIQHFRDIIQLDSIFLKRMELMDYSLFLVKLTLSKDQMEELFGKNIQMEQEKDFNNIIESKTLISNSSLNTEKFSYNSIIIPERKISVSKNGKIFKNSKYYQQYIYSAINRGNAYILAIIDYFQIFNFYKYIESTLKTKFSSKNDKVSCVDPDAYSKRFIEYFNQLTNIKHMLKDGQKNDSSNFKNIEIISVNNKIDEEANENDNISEHKPSIELKHFES